MRNLFDQYNQPENRLTHALAVCLDEDRTLLRSFLEWIAVTPTVRANALKIVEQTLPGDVPESEEVAQRKGLPDIVIHDGAEWCLLIENKVMAVLSDDQLARHERTLRRRGFEQVRRLVIEKDIKAIRQPKETSTKTWSLLYEWLGMNGGRGEWSERLRSYLRAAEVRLALENYLTEGTLTMFDGFPFSEENTYTYGEGKRLLKLAMKELREDQSLIALGMDSKAPGRPAITGRDGKAVWDFLSLADRPKDGAFTSYPHLTLAVYADHLEVAITIPNGVVRPVQKRLMKLGSEGFTTLNGKILRRAKAILSKDKDARLEAYASQRHFLSQRSSATIDAKLTFNLQTSESRGTGPVKRQPEWVKLFAELFSRKRSNIQFGYMMHLPWGTQGLDGRDSLRLIANSWCAMKPLLDLIRGVEKSERDEPLP